MDAGRVSRWWMWGTITTSLMAVVLFIALVVVLISPFRFARVSDGRLLGTWQSDAERTIAGIREARPVDDEQEAAFRKLFGKMRVTYTQAEIAIELDGTTELSRYEVLGKDKHSVVLREVARKPSPTDDYFELSEFTVIQFEGPDTYWLHTKIGDLREYFKRIR